MESYLETAFLATSYASLGLTLLASVPTALSIARRLTNKVLPWHQDDFRSGARPDDVEESNESTSLLPVKLPEVSLGNWHHFGVTLPTLTGLGASLADIAVTEDKEFLVPLILQTGVWALLSVQAAALPLERSPGHAQTLSRYSSWTSFLAMLTPCLGAALEWYKNPPTPTEASSGLMVTQIGLAAVRAGFSRWVSVVKDLVIDDVIDRFTDETNAGSNPPHSPPGEEDKHAATVSQFKKFWRRLLNKTTPSEH